MSVSSPAPASPSGSRPATRAAVDDVARDQQPRRAGRRSRSGSAGAAAGRRTPGRSRRRPARLRACVGDLDLDPAHGQPLLRAAPAAGRRSGRARRLVSASKMTISSSRLTNSGLNDCRTTASTDSFFLSGSRVGSTRYCRAQVAGQDQQRVPEVDGAALAVGEPAVVEDLQQDVEDLGVGLLDLVEQHHRVGPASRPPRSAGRPRRSRRSRGVRPTSRATECFSEYSLMSIRTIARSSSNRKSASARASSVLPVPVGRGTGTSRSAGAGR